MEKSWPSVSQAENKKVPLTRGLVFIVGLSFSKCTYIRHYILRAIKKASKANRLGSLSNAGGSGEIRTRDQRIKRLKNCAEQ